MARRVAFLDTETTGLDWLKGHRLIEVAAVVYDMDTRVRLGAYEQRINPQRDIDPKAQEVHGISWDQLLAEPLWEEVGPKFAMLLGKCEHHVAHNGEGFDFPFLIHEFQRIGVAPPVIRSTDTMLQARWATPDGSLPRLELLAFACGVPYDRAKAHAALYDVEVMAQCFFSQVDRGFFRLETAPFVPTPPEVRK